jgi:prophage DNA circulation protein
MADFLKDEIRPASFRGVSFHVSATVLQAGRRMQLNEYPQRDKPYLQDMGRRTRQIDFDAFVVGKDYIAKAGELLTALETKGAGALIHPFFGKMDVTVFEMASVQFDEALGVATFSLSFIEAGELAYPKTQPATAQTTKQKTSGLLSTVQTVFGAVYRTAGFVNQVAVKALQVYGMAMQVIYNPLGFAASALGLVPLVANLQAIAGAIGMPFTLANSFNEMLSVAPQAAGGLLTAGASSPAGVDAALSPLIVGLTDMASHPAMADPLGITSSLSPSVANPDYSGIAGNPLLSAPAQLQYLDKASAYAMASDLTLIPGGYLPIPDLQTAIIATPSQQHQFSNTAMTLLQTRLILLGNAAGLSSMLACAVYDDIIRIRDALCAALDREALALSSSMAVLDVAQAALLGVGLPGVAIPVRQWQSLTIAIIELRAAVWEDLTARARDSARLRDHRIYATLPGLAVAYDLYEDVAREPEIAARNRLPRPGFVPAGIIRVLSA